MSRWMLENHWEVCPLCDYAGHEDHFRGSFCEGCYDNAKRCQVCYEWLDKRLCDNAGSFVCKQCYKIYENVKQLVEASKD